MPKNNKWSDMRIGKRIALDDELEVNIEGDTTYWNVEGVDVSPTAVAILVPVEHELMQKLPQLFKPGEALIVSHERFNKQRTVLHRVFRARENKTRWVLSFVNRLELK